MTRETVGQAELAILIEEYDSQGNTQTLVVPADSDLGVMGLPELVYDRIEANGRVTLPDLSDRPQPGDRQYLGSVEWDSNGIPITLELPDKTVYFTDSGGVDYVEEH